jgi:DNA polymerase I
MYTHQGEKAIAAERAYKRLVLIDGKSIFYRGYYAMPELATKDGTPTGGVYGFTTLSLEVIKKLQPDYVGIAWDKPKTNIRSRLALYPEYKAGRKPAPDDFYAQIPILHELLEAFGWPLYELDDYEADDIMATLAEQARQEDIETVLVTSDLDVLQCVNGHVKVYALKKGLSNIEEFHPESFIAKYGIEPHQFIDLKALKGDSSDNIPGVPGIGEKTAIELLKKYETLDNVYENIELIQNSVKDKLLKGKDSAYLSKKLVTLFTDAPIKLDLPAMDVKKFDAAKLRANLEKLEFKSLLRQLPEVSQEVADGSAGVAPRGKLHLPALVKPEAFNAGPNQPIYVASFAKDGKGLQPYSLILGTREQVAVFDLPEDNKKLLALKDSLINSDLIGYDVKHQMHSLKGLGIECKKIGHDIQVAAFLLDSLRAPKTLSRLAEYEIDYELEDLSLVPPEDIANYAAELVGVLHSLHHKQIEQLAQMPKLADLAKNIEWPVIPVLTSMEEQGIGLDTEYLNTMSHELEDQISDIEQTIYGFANHEFNISSPAQLSQVLFEELGLPTVNVKKGKAGVYSTAAAELSRLRDYNPIIDCISRYREYTKLKSTYVDTLPTMVGNDGKIHTSFNLTVAQTGRLSSSDPNLQNIPVRSELGKTIRTAFVAGKGNVFVSADYSQFELRLAAVLAGDGDMIEVFNSEADIHTRTASEIYGIALEDVTKEQRNNAKTINFGVLYGMSPHGLSNATHLTFDEAREFIERYFAARKPLIDYIDSLKQKALSQGYVETLFGRRRPTPDVKSPNFIIRQAAVRQAVNMPIQGTEADLMKMAMIEIDKNLPKDCYQLLQIHDSILVECPEGKSHQVSGILKDVMENIYPSLGVRLAVEVHSGRNWGEL